MTLSTATHHDNGHPCRVPTLRHREIEIRFNWGSTALIGTTWSCMQCETQCHINDPDRAYATALIHALTCGNGTYPDGRRIQNDVFNRVGVDTGWSAVHETAQARICELTEQLNDLPATAAAQAAELKTARADLDTLSANLVQERRRARAWRIATTATALAAVLTVAILAIV